MNFTRSSLFFCAFVSLMIQAPAQTTSLWTGQGFDGQWATPQNWTPTGEPTSSSMAIVNFDSTITLPTTSVGSLYIQSATVNLSTGGNTFTLGDFSVDSGSVANIAIGAGGSVVSTNSASPAVSSFVGDASGSGTLNLTDAGSLNFTSTTLGSGVGIGGTGVFNQSGSTTVNVTGAGQVAFFAIGADGNVTTPPSIPDGSSQALGGVGTYTISQSATLNVDNLAVGLGSGLGGGAGTGGSTATSGVLYIQGGSVNVTNLLIGASSQGLTNAVANVSGAVYQSAGTATIANLDVGVVSGAVATYNLSGGTLTVTSDLNIGGSGATASMTQSSGSTLNINGTFEIGTNGGAASFNYNGGTINAGGGITVGSGGIFNQNATFDAVANPITLTGGTYSLNAGTLRIGGDTSMGTSDITGPGNLNFAGGTAIVTSTWMDTLNSRISNTSIINTTAASATLSGVLSGNGTLDLIGGNTVNITGASNSGSWGARLTGGSTLTASSVNSLSTSGSYVIGSGSTFNLGSTGAAVDTFYGSVSNTPDIAGAATFNVTGLGANKLVLAGVTNLSGNSATNIGSGTLEVDHGIISNVTGTNVSDTLDIGNGSAPGTVTLLGANLLPTVTVNGGSTLVAGNSAGGLAITGDVDNRGALATLGSFSAPAALLIGGTLTSSGSLLVNSNGQSADTFGSAAVPLRSANLSGKIVVTGVGSVSNIPIVYTTNGVTATIGSAPGDLNTNAPTALFSSSLTIQGNTLELSTHQNFVTSFARTTNEAAVGRAFDQIIARGLPFPPSFVPVILKLNSFDAAQIPVALEQYTPQSLQYARNIAFENSSFLAERMNAVDGDLRNGSGGLDTNAISIIAPGFDSNLGRSLGSLLAYNEPPYHTPGVIGNDFYPGDTTDSSPSYAPSSSKREFGSSSQSMSDSNPSSEQKAGDRSGFDWSRVGEFVGGDVILADLNQNQSAANAPSSKASYTAGDATAGISYRMTSHLSAGVLFDYNHTDAATDSSGSKTTVDTYSPGVFATYFDHGFYANGLFSFGYNNYSNSRNIGFLNETASSHPSGEQYVGNLDVGYDFHPDKAWVVGPTLGVTYTHLDIDSFSETGAPSADLAVQEQNVDSLRSRFGGHLIYQTMANSILLQPNFTAMWQHEYMGSGPGITSSILNDGTSPFTIQTTGTDRNSALIGVGLTATFDHSIAVYLNYLADVNTSDYFAQSVVAGLKAQF